MKTCARATVLVKKLLRDVFGKFPKNFVKRIKSNTRASTIDRSIDDDDDALDDESSRPSSLSSSSNNHSKDHHSCKRRGKI